MGQELLLKNNDILKLFLRVALGVIILFHGVHKLRYGIGSIEGMIIDAHWPHYFAYGVYIGELIAPLFIILGLYARVASLLLALNMLVAIYLAYGFHFTLTSDGAISYETPLLFFILSLLVFFQGSGRYSINTK